ncbi:MAG: polyprenyl synthetase family protein [Acidimicrobiia bacterium]
MSRPDRASAPSAAPASLAVVGDRAEARIRVLLDAERERWSRVDPSLGSALDALRALVVAGGKRLRPAFCHWAYVGAGGDPDDEIAVDAGAALELLHSFALVHDDIMDGSERRRGQPAVHRAFMDRHRDAGWRGQARRFGEGAAILVGDFAFVYADVLVARIPADAREVFDELRLELCVGQYLDLSATAAGGRDKELARTIEWYKSGKYTVERPLHLGAALAGRLEELRAPLSAFGLPLGEAFQLRDDLLGVFGSEAVTGKPVGDDLREGKLTPLLAAASARVSGPDLGLFERVGSDDLSNEEIGAICDLLSATGAVAEIEARIETLVDESLEALEQVPITDTAKIALAELGRFVAWRDR